MNSKSLATLVLILIGLYSCQTEEQDFVTETNSFVTLNLETYVPDSSLDNTVRGKYVGVIGHHTNSLIHGKIYINSGQHGQYNALVNMTDGNRIKFTGTPQTKDASVVFFKGDIGSFTISFEDYLNPVISSVQFTNESTDGYLVLQKSIKGVDAVVITGTYEDSTNPGFNGNWDLIGDGTVTIVDVAVTVPGVPFPVTLNVPTELIGTLSVSHTGSTMPLTDTTFETNTTLDCIAATFPDANFPTAPFIIPTDIPSPLGGFLGGEGSISSGGQTSLLNGFNANWSLSYGDPIEAANFPGGFTDDSCTPSMSGTWSWNTRTGTISIDGI